MLQKISRYRTEIMGMAILWVVLFHARIDFPSALFLPVQFVKDLGYGAVDLFFFLSGFGLFCSWSKGCTVREFYTARLMRILPTYWIAVALYYGIEWFSNGTVSIVRVAAMATGLNFYLYNDKFFWFVPAIVACYLLFPFLVRWIRFNTGTRHLAGNVLVALFATLLLSLAITATEFSYLLIFTLRLPVFVLGIYAGYVYVHQQDQPWFESAKVNGVIGLSGIVCLSLVLSLTVPDTRWRYGFWWYPFMLLAYPLCLLIAYLYERIDEYVPSSSILSSGRACVLFCGRYSLEIFLLHLVIFRTFPVILQEAMPRAVESRLNTGRIAEYGAYVLVTLCLAPMVNRFAALCVAPIPAARRNP
ncbi:MAG: acyltransferase [Nitrospira sp.]|nr:acyltransferase [Nitrospira sp.]